MKILKGCYNTYFFFFRSAMTSENYSHLFSLRQNRVISFHVNYKRLTLEKLMSHAITIKTNFLPECKYKTFLSKLTRVSTVIMMSIGLVTEDETKIDTLEFGWKSGGVTLSRIGESQNEIKHKACRYKYSLSLHARGIHGSYFGKSRERV